MRFYCFFTSLLLFSVFFETNAQSPSNVVNLLHPDQRRLELLTYEAVNKLRKNVKLEDLVWDDVLYRAAVDHADYLIKEAKISHFQTVAEKRTPAKRVKVHGGLIYTVVGENIVEVPLGVQVNSNGVKKSTVTYKSAASTMTQLWQASSGHYKNIISKNYNCTALATSYDSKTQRLIAVQVFGYTNTPASDVELPDLSKHLLDLPKPRLPHGLKESRPQPKNKTAITKFSNIKVDRGYITCSYKEAKKIFKGRRSGICQEFIPLTQYDSASAEFASVPNRRNALFELNGQLSRPIYRRELLRYSRKNTFRRYFIYTKLVRIKRPATTFIYPLDPNTRETEFNLFLVKNKRLEAYRTYIMIPSGLFDMEFPKLAYTNSFKPREVKENFREYHIYDTLRLEVFYSSGRIDIDTIKEKEIKKAFKSIQGKITAVEAAAFASIEGDKASNEQLARSRMEYFMHLAKPYLDSSMVDPIISSREQWKLFNTQIEETHLQHLKAMKADEVRRYVNENKKDSLLSKLLDAQRYMQLTLIWRQDFKELLPSKSTVEIFDSLKKEIRKYPKPSRTLINAFEQTQLALYYELSQTDTVRNSLPKVPELEQYPAFRYHELIYQYTVLRNLSDNTFFHRLHSLGKSKYFPGKLKNQLIYNNLVFIYNLYSNGLLENIIDYDNMDCYKARQHLFFLKEFKNLRCRKTNTIQSLYSKNYFILKEIPAFIAVGKREKVKEFPEQELWQYYNLYTIHSLFGFIPLNPEIYSLLPGFKKYFHPDDRQLNDAERLKMAYFYCALSRNRTAKNLIEPLVKGPEPNKEALKLYLTLVFEDYENEHEFAELLITEFSRLGKEEWCDLWLNPNYLNFLLLENLKLKKFYNCNCPR